MARALRIEFEGALYHVMARGNARFIADGVNADDPFNQMPRPGFLGTESFIETILEKFDSASVST